jgi:hypothetical protein
LPLSLEFGEIVGLLAKYRSTRHVRKLQAGPIFTSMGKTNKQPLGQRDVGGGYSERGSNFMIEYGRDRNDLISLT